MTIRLDHIRRLQTEGVAHARTPFAMMIEHDIVASDTVGLQNNSLVHQSQHYTQIG